MGEDLHDGIGSLPELQRDLEQWRATRTRRRIPAVFKERAVALLKEHRRWHILTALRINNLLLRQWEDKHGARAPETDESKEGGPPWPKPPLSFPWPPPPPPRRKPMSDNVVDKKVLEDKRKKAEVRDKWDAAEIRRKRKEQMTINSGYGGFPWPEPPKE